MARVYCERRDRLVQVLSATAGHALKIIPPAGGMQLLAHLDPRLDDVDIVDRLARAGVTARALSRHMTGQIVDRGLFLGFAAWNEREIDAGAALVGSVMRNVRPRP
jgi:GntR family transcriptional regulator/MocR family aminotransferase